MSKNGNNALIFKSVDTLGAEYASIFRDLDFDQNQFKFRTFPNEENKEIATTVSKTGSASVTKLQKQLDNNEPRFNGECEVLQSKSMNLDQKLMDLYKDVDLGETVDEIKDVEIEDANGGFDDHKKKFDACCEILQTIAAETSLSQFMKNDLEQRMNSIMEEYDSDYSALTCSRKDSAKMDSVINECENDYELIGNYCNDLQKIVFSADEKFQCLAGFEQSKDDCRNIESLFHTSTTEFATVQAQIGDILKEFNENHLKSKYSIQEDEKELQEHERIVENLKNKKAGLRNLYYECVQKTENLFLQIKHEDEEFVRECEDSTKRIEEMDTEREEKQKTLDLVKGKEEKTKILLENLSSMFSKLKQEESNLEEDGIKLTAAMNALDREEAILTQTQTEIKIEMAVERTLQQQYEKMKLLQEDNFSEIQNFNQELKKVFDEMQVFNKEL